MDDSVDLLGPHGPLANGLPGFAVRPSQQDMAARIEQALAQREIFIAESGTGTGKTFAYLVPALCSGKKVLISTGTKNLQDQLFHRDLPLMRTLLARPVNVALLKGRANYLCLYRLARAHEQPLSAPAAHHLRRLQDWAQRTRTGDIAEVSEVSEDAEVWPLVTSTRDNCLGNRCPNYDDCHLNRARREALKAEVLVINHHLFCADLVLREEGFGQLLPGVDAVIFDEAHQLPEVATAFFGQSVRHRQLLDLCRDVAAEETAANSAVPGLVPATQALEHAVADFRSVLGREPRRVSWPEVNQTPAVQKAFDRLTDDVNVLCALLQPAAGHSEGFANCMRRAQDLSQRLQRIRGEEMLDHVVWVETSQRGFGLHLTPLDVAAPFREHLAGYDKTWIFTSATLAVGGNFDYFLAQLGLTGAATALWESPFDYHNQAMLYVPRGLPHPSDKEYTRRVTEAAVPVLAASGGRAFMLFTSHRALRQAAELLAPTLAFPLLVQGSAPQAELLERFRAAGNAVLLGTASFWEGVDVRGDALSCVIIDKLPFAPPDDPLLQARAQVLAAAGRNPFMEYQLPEAVIALKQGAGRLIRDALDRGVLVLCDPRLLSKNYGRLFLASLPSMPFTRDLDDVKNFFSQGEALHLGE